jgi:carbon monoxide dehydrogenase subunit G
VKIALSHSIPADRERVFAALVDPETLRRSMPGCDSLTATGPDAYEATLKIGVAGLKGTYRGRAVISNKQPPESLTLSFDGKGAPGFVRGSAAIVLSSADGGTRVACEADVQCGGLIAAVGSRLIEAAARRHIARGRESHENTKSRKARNLLDYFRVFRFFVFFRDYQMVE